MHHDLKLLQPFFEAKLLGLKPWELRYSGDRTFQEGDTVTFHEVVPDDRGDPVYTGRVLGPERILYLLNDAPRLKHQTCVFTHHPIAPSSSRGAGAFQPHPTMEA